MIEIQNLTFQYLTDETNTLDNISLKVAQGSKLAIIGSSGGGKTTLLKILAGLLDHDNHSGSGTVFINGISAIENRRKGKLGYLFQDFKLLPFLNVIDNVCWPLKFSGSIDYGDSCSQKDVSGILEAVGLSKYRDKLPKELSGGMKARVALARAIVNKPSLLLIDEAFSSLDIGWRSELYGLLGMLGEKYRWTVVFVSHDLDDVAFFADSCLVLNPVPLESVYFSFNNLQKNILVKKLREEIIKSHRGCS